MLGQAVDEAVLAAGQLARETGQASGPQQQQQVEENELQYQAQDKLSQQVRGAVRAGSGVSKSSSQWRMRTLPSLLADSGVVGPRDRHLGADEHGDREKEGAQ